MSEIITPDGVIDVPASPVKKLAFVEELERHVASPRNDIRVIIVETLDRLRYFNITDQISSVYKDITRGYVHLTGSNKTVMLRYIPAEETNANGKQNGSIALTPILNQRIIPMDKIMAIDVIDKVDDFKEILNLIGRLR